MTGLEKITEKIMQEAKSDAENILAEARERAKQISDSYLKKSEELRENMLLSASGEAKQLNSRVDSGILMKNRNLHQRAEAALVDEAFSTALERMHSLPEEDYLKFLGKLLLSVIREQYRAEKEGLELYGEEDRVVPDTYELILNETDRKKYGENLVLSVRRALSDGEYRAIADKLVLSEESAPIDGGLILRCGDISCNCSLQNLLQEARNRCENEVRWILFSE